MLAKHPSRGGRSLLYGEVINLPPPATDFVNTTCLHTYHVQRWPETKRMRRRAYNGDDSSLPKGAQVSSSCFMDVPVDK